jgi:thioredoxin 1
MKWCLSHPGVLGYGDKRQIPLRPQPELIEVPLMPRPPQPPCPVLVICLCAQWCSTCRDYHATFQALANELPQAQWVWIDIEDHADFVEPIEVENFPTILIGHQLTPLFFGPIVPHAGALRRLVAEASAGKMAALQDANQAKGLLERIGSRAEPQSRHL